MYRIKHLPTGLYYCPVHGRWPGEKTNLSKVGKIYGTYNKNRFKDYVGYTQISDNQLKGLDLETTTNYSKQNVLVFHPADWVVEQIDYEVINKFEL